MAQFESFAPGVEVAGEVIQAYIAGFPLETQELGSKILKTRGIDGPQPGYFYPLQALLDSMKELSDVFGPAILYRIGERIAFTAKLPREMELLESCLPAIDTAYHMNHRGGEIGHYSYKYVGIDCSLHRAKMVCCKPYPSYFDWGVIEGFAKRFKPEECLDIIVRLDMDQPTRREGEDSCTYMVSWA